MNQERPIITRTEAFVWLVPLALSMLYSGAILAAQLTDTRSAPLSHRLGKLNAAVNSSGVLEIKNGKEFVAGLIEQNAALEAYISWIEIAVALNALVFICLSFRLTFILFRPQDQSAVAVVKL